jgi:copper resistance protein B
MTAQGLSRLLVWVALLGPGVPAAFAQADPHAGHHPPAPPPAAPAARGELPAFIPALTDEDRKAAFPDVEGHAVHDRAIHSFVLIDQLEWQRPNQLSIDTRGWVGRDRDRFWFRAEAERDDDAVTDAGVHLLYGRQVARWWDVVAGVRQDVRPGHGETFVAFGVQGLAPQWFEIEATGYVGTSGQIDARFAVEYELLLTNRLVLQPLLEAEIVGRSDSERAVGAGLSTTEFGLRVRYEFRRELAPYLGILWSRKWGATASRASAAGGERADVRLVTGVRFWF